MRVTLLIAITALLLPGCGSDSPVVPLAARAPIFLGEWGSRGSGPGEFYQPSEIAIAPDGSVWVIDHQNERLQQFDRDGGFLQQWGGEIEPGIFFTRLINALAIHRDRIFVSDILTGRLYVLTLGGQLLEIWDYFGVHGGLAVDGDGAVVISGYKVVQREPPVRIDGPKIWRLDSRGRELGSQDLELGAIALDREGALYGVQTRAVDGLPRSAVLKLSRSGEILKRWETDDASTLFDDLAVDGSGNIFVANRPNQSIYKFSRFGYSAAGSGLLVGWHSPGLEGRPFSWPAGLAVDARNHLYVSDFNQDRILQFAPPTP